MALFKPALLALLLSLSLPSSLHALDSVNSDVTVTECTRTIDLASQLVKQTLALTLSNGGSGAVRTLHFAVEKEWADKVVYIGATSGSSEKAYLRVSETKLNDKKDAAAWRIELKDAIPAGGTKSLDVEVILGKTLEMFPKEISQRERQLVLFSGNHYLYTPYKVKTQTTRVILPSSTIESYSKNLKPVSQTDTTVTYGPYSNVESFSESPLSVHFENNNAFLVVTRLERTIELSMWGNIAVEETVDVRHDGALLKGSFSRYEFQRENSGVSSVKNFKTVLPAAASDVYYRDDIGNISTSSLRELADAVELDLRPRFPLFGGWKTHYFIGYNVPSYEYLFHKGDNFALNMRVVDHVFDDMLVEDFTLNIILPEGAVVGKLHTPYPLSRKSDGRHYTYLDTQGRPVVRVTNIGDLSEKHIQDFQLEFTFPKTFMVREPLLLIAAFFLFFFLTIIYVRLDFAITKDEGSEARMKVAGVCEKILGHQDRRNAAYAAFDDALSRLKSSKDASAFAASTKKIGTDHKAETQSVADLAAGLKSLSAEVAEKVGELQKADRTVREHQQTQSQLVEKLVTGKLPKQQFVDQESVLLRKRDEAKDKIATVSAQLRAV